MRHYKQIRRLGHIKKTYRDRRGALTVKNNVATMDCDGYTLIFDEKFDVPVERVNINSQGYVRFGHDYAHRIVIGAKQGQIVDHINGNRLDNRLSNLRFCTRQTNAYNKNQLPSNKSGYRGVHAKSNGKWCAQIQKNRKTKHIGVFADPAAAARAYDKVAKRMHGEFARLNFGAVND